MALSSEHLNERVRTSVRQTEAKQLPTKNMFVPIVSGTLHGKTCNYLHVLIAHAVYKNG